MACKCIAVVAQTSVKGERPFLVLDIRAEDNFAQSEKISYPILNIGKSFRTPAIFQENVLVPHIFVLEI